MSRNKTNNFQIKFYRLEKKVQKAKEDNTGKERKKKLLDKHIMTRRAQYTARMERVFSTFLKPEQASEVLLAA